MTAPLRIGVLGAARIADEGIIAPARTLAHQVVAVAARDRSRAEAFAAERGIASGSASWSPPERSATSAAQTFPAPLA